MCIFMFVFTFMFSMVLRLLFRLSGFCFLCVSGFGAGPFAMVRCPPVCPGFGFFSKGRPDHDGEADIHEGGPHRGRPVLPDALRVQGKHLAEDAHALPDEAWREERPIEGLVVVRGWHRGENATTNRPTPS